VYHAGPLLVYFFNLETVRASCTFSQCASVSSHPFVLPAIPSHKPKEGRATARVDTRLTLDTTGLVKYICFLDWGSRHSVQGKKKPHTAGWHINYANI